MSNPYLIEAQNAKLFDAARDPDSKVNTMDFDIGSAASGVLYVRSQVERAPLEPSVSTDAVAVTGGTSWDYLGAGVELHG